MKHTPGPWHYGEAKNGKRYAFGGDNKPLISPNVKGTNRPIEEIEGNLQMLSMSLELLSALRLLLNDSKDFHDEPDADELRSGYHSNCGWCVARKVIAKAGS